MVDSVAPDAGPSSNEARAATEALLNSASFENAPRLRRFLKYIVDLTLSGEGASINEYLIGREVFERDADYSPGDDAVVRRQAHALRQKLLRYYADEGAGAAVRIELPLGAYVATFRYASPQKIDAGPASAPVSAPAPARGRIARRSVALAAASGTALFALGGLLGSRLRPMKALRPDVSAALREIWGPWLDDPIGITLCVSNPKTAAIRQVNEAAVLGRQIAAASDEDRAYRSAFKLPPGGSLSAAPDTSSGKLLETYAAVRLTSLFASHGATVRPTQSRLLSWEILRRENVILLGHEENNRWVTPLLEKLPLQMVPPEGGQRRRIVQIGPNGVEAAFQNSRADDPDHATEQFALISMIRGPADSRQVALIGGLESPATDMAADFLTRPDSLDELVGRLKAAAPAGHAPWYFQAVLRAEVRDRYPMRGTIVVLRLLPAQ